MLKNDFFCGINGMPVAPDFSAKAHGTEDPNSIRPTKFSSYTVASPMGSKSSGLALYNL
jgi:hypothetical protein